jgi:hypothetical protein
MRGIFFREQFKSPLAPLFQKGESIDWSMPTEIVGMNNLTCEKTKDFKIESQNLCGALRFEFILDSSGLAGGDLWTRVAGNYAEQFWATTQAKTL